MCIYAHIRTHLYAGTKYAHIYTSACNYIYTYTHTYINTQNIKPMYVDIYVYIHKYSALTYMSVFVNIYVYVHTQTHVYINRYACITTCIGTHTQRTHILNVHVNSYTHTRIAIHKTVKYMHVYINKYVF